MYEPQPVTCVFTQHDLLKEQSDANRYSSATIIMAEFYRQQFLPSAIEQYSTSATADWFQ